MKLEETILKELIHNEEYMRKVLPFLKNNYFDKEHRLVFEILDEYIIQYNEIPTKSQLEIILDDKVITQDMFDQANELVSELYVSAPLNNIEWMISQTEQWCKLRACICALLEANDIISEKSKKTIHTIPEIMQEAVNITFDTSVGHDYFKDAEARYDFYKQKVAKIPFDLKVLNDITQGGVERKTLNCVAGTSGAGKSLFMCYLAADYIKLGYNVLYISLEMGEEKIAERIDANLLNTDITNIKNIIRGSFVKQIDSLRTKCRGDLIIKEFPSASSHVGHFRVLLQELQMKRNFIPDIIMVDYLSIAASARVKDAGNLYSYVKSIAEELRGLAQQTNTAIWTATQLGRKSYGATEIEMSDTAESMGLPNTLDFYLALIRTEELDEENKVLLKQLKSRYNDKTIRERFVLGLDRPKFKFFETNDNNNYDGTYREKEDNVSEFKQSQPQRSKGFEGFKI